MLSVQIKKSGRLRYKRLNVSITNTLRPDKICSTYVQKLLFVRIKRYCNARLPQFNKKNGVSWDWLSVSQLLLSSLTNLTDPLWCSNDATRPYNKKDRYLTNSQYSRPSCPLAGFSGVRSLVELNVAVGAFFMSVPPSSNSPCLPKYIYPMPKNLCVDRAWKGP